MTKKEQKTFREVRRLKKRGRIKENLPEVIMFLCL